MIRSYRVADSGQVLALNEANVPEVGKLNEPLLELLAVEAKLFVVLEVDEKIEGALVVLAEGSGYESLNYRWFAARYAEFAYVDRIMLSANVRGQGWGLKLYDQAVALANSQHKPVLVAEVNTIPPNERSYRFHQLYGFVEVARTQPYGDNSEVAMFEVKLG